jgi:hypothetical protein
LASELKPSRNDEAKLVSSLRYQAREYPSWPLILKLGESFGFHPMRIDWATARPLWGVTPIHAFGDFGNPIRRPQIQYV